MVELIYINGILEFKGDFFKVISADSVGDTMVHIHIYNEIYNEIIGLSANQTTINAILQTSAQMIIDTLNA